MKMSKEAADEILAEAKKADTEPRYATGEERYELQAAFGDEADYVVNIITGQRTYFNY